MENLVINRNFWNRKKVFLTGHTGFKGSWLSIWLQYLGAQVIGYSLRPQTNPNLFSLAKVSSNMASHYGDVRDYSKLEKIFKRYKPHIVIHMAAQAFVQKGYAEPHLTYSTNIMGTVNILELVRKHGNVKYFLNVTSDKCYENVGWIWGYRENDLLGGLDPYSNSKACSDSVTRAYAESYFNKENSTVIATARAGNVIGGGDWSPNRLLPDCIRAWLKNKRATIRNPDANRPWQHVLNPLSGYLMLVEKMAQNGREFSGSWNFGPDVSDSRPVGWVVGRFAEIFNKKQYIAYADKKQIYPESMVLRLDSSKAKIKMGWYPKWDIETSLGKIASWLGAYQAGKDMRIECLNQIKEFMN